MNRLHNLFVPRSAPDLIFRGVLILILVLLLNALLSRVVGGPGALSFLQDGVVATLVATPFIGVILSLIWRMYALQERLTELAATDMLTGLPNRRHFLRSLERPDGTLPPGMLLILDIDHFKRINDTHGHAVGDLVLQAVAQHLRAALAEGDLVARVGGEEFALFLHSADREEVLRRTEALTVVPPVEADGQAIRVTVSIGASPSEVSAALVDVMRRADSALYRAKAEGRARLAFFEPEAARVA